MDVANLAPCTILDWDTAFWGFRIARVQGDSLSEACLSAIDAWAREQRARCLFFLSPADDPQTTAAVERGGFHLVDVRSTLGCTLLSASEPDLEPPAESVSIRPSAPGDVERLAVIARAIHHDTRFYFDRHFPRPLCDELYATWIRNSCQGYADTVLVAEVGGQPAGYISCHVDRAARTGTIGLVGVSDRVRARGVGTALVQASLAWFHAASADRVMVITQARNVAALRLYERCGFLTEDVRLWYHKWYPVN